MHFLIVYNTILHNNVTFLHSHISYPDLENAKRKLYKTFQGCVEMVGENVLIKRWNHCRKNMSGFLYRIIYKITRSGMRNYNIKMEEGNTQ